MSTDAISGDALSAETVPVKLLILALGGEGGAVMADWIVDALLAADYPVQSTSVPGVAQRTGATSYYIEFLPIKRTPLRGAEPVFCLSPAPGQIDVLISSELLETGRAIERGLVSPQQTTLISSTSRFLTVHEKMHMADGRLNDDRVVQAARAMSRRCVLFDMAKATSDAGTVISAVMFGALIASGTLPITREQGEQIVGGGARGAQASLIGYILGFDACAAQLAVNQNTREPEHDSGRHPERQPTVDGVRTVESKAQTVLVQNIALPERVAEIAQLGFARLLDYQDREYANHYLRRVEQFVNAEGGGSEFAASRTAARFLALWMAYEDVIRVADLKSRGERFARIRGEFGAKENEPVLVRDFLKPGVEEVAAILPEGLARRLTAWAARRNKTSFSNGLRLQTSSVSGLLLMRSMAALRGWRRRSSRFTQEQALIERWSQALLIALPLNPRLAREIAECPRLIKGYSDTFARGKRSFVEILERLIEPALKAGADRDATVWDATADSIKRAREAALEDPAGRALAQSLGLPVPVPKEQPLRFVPMKRPKH